MSKQSYQNNLWHLYFIVTSCFKKKFQVGNLHLMVIEIERSHFGRREKKTIHKKLHFCRKKVNRIVVELVL